MILFPFIGDSIGGSFYSAIGFYRALISKKHSAVIVIFEASGPIASFLDKEKISYICYTDLKIPRYQNPIQYLLFMVQNFRSAIAFLKKVQPMIVVSNDIRMNFFFTFYAGFFRFRHIWFQRKRMPRSIVMQAIMALNWRVVCVSQFVADGAKLSVLKNKISVIGNIISIPDITDPIYSFRKNESDALRVGFIGPLRMQKGKGTLEALINGQVGLKRELEYHLFCGDVNSQQKNLFRNQGLIWHEYCFNRDRIFSSFDVLLCLGTDEGFGRTLIESLLHRVPVIAISSGAHVEVASIVEYNGITIVNSLEGIVNQLNRFDVNQNRVDLSEILPFIESFNAKTTSNLVNTIGYGE